MGIPMVPVVKIAGAVAESKSPFLRPALLPFEGGGKSRCDSDDLDATMVRARR
jgi:hypothetical protein